MKIEIHFQDAPFQANGQSATFKPTFEHIANITVPPQLEAHPKQALEYAWRYTNNVEGSWSQGPELTMPDGSTQENGDYNAGTEVLVPLAIQGNRTYGHRSAMVGDRFIIVSDTDGADGNIPYRVASFGFDRELI
jgi:hypothetical protein